jgi:hypothetical protein
VSIDGLGIGNYTYTLHVYDTAGNSTSDIVLVTVVDTTPPTIDSAADLVYEYGTAGHTIVWTPHDLHLASFSIWRNQTPISGAWDGMSITVSVDTLPLGVYNFTLVVYDTSSNSASDKVFITVVDNTAPTIDRPADQTYQYGTIGHTVTWNPLDPNPASYAILRDGSGLASGLWNGTTISISADGLGVGSYNYTIVVYDTSGNSISDQVIVTVNAATTTTTTTTTTSTTTQTGNESPLSGPFAMLTVVEGAVIVVLIVVLYVRRK